MSASIIIITPSLLGIILINVTDVGNFRQIEFLMVETFY